MKDDLNAQKKEILARINHRFQDPDLSQDDKKSVLLKLQQIADELKSLTSKQDQK